VHLSVLGIWVLVLKKTRSSKRDSPLTNRQILNTDYQIPAYRASPFVGRFLSSITVFQLRARRGPYSDFFFAARELGAPARTPVGKLVTVAIQPARVFRRGLAGRAAISYHTCFAVLAGAKGRSERRSTRCICFCLCERSSVSASFLQVRGQQRKRARQTAAEPSPSASRPTAQRLSVALSRVPEGGGASCENIRVCSLAEDLAACAPRYHSVCAMRFRAASSALRSQSHADSGHRFLANSVRIPAW